jgi:hypothetical protein
VNVDLVAGDCLSAALGWDRDFGLQVLRDRSVSLCTLSLWEELWYLVVDDICNSSRCKSENGCDLHLDG